MMAKAGLLHSWPLLGVKKQHRPAIVAAGLFGAALIYGDGTITPAISVLSALEGMEQIAPSLQPLSMRIAKLTYLIVVTTNKVQRIRDNAPSVVAASGLAPVRLRTVFNV